MCELALHKSAFANRGAAAERERLNYTSKMTQIRKAADKYTDSRCGSLDTSFGYTPQ